VKPHPGMIKLAIVIATGVFVALFAWLLVDTWRANAALEPNPMQLFLTPIFSGALGLVLALSLGVEPAARGEAWFTEKRLLLIAAVIYLVAAVVGGVVWAFRQDETPELVSALVLTVAGYLAASVTAAARA
jgi:cytochrome bd-type quinol oxidase subunit 2